MARKKTQEEFLQDLKVVWKDSIITTDTYTGANNKIWFHCNRGLGHKPWKATPQNILSGHGCRECGYLSCAIKESVGSKIIKQRIEEVWGDRLKILSICNSTKGRLKVQCTICNHIWKPYYTNLIRGKSCPKCVSSIGEQLVASILEFNKIDYDPQHDFKIKGRTHRLDFVLKDSNDTWCVIQPDGSQHTWKYKQFKRSKADSERAFYERVSKDRDENKYLPALGVRVLRIPWIWFDLDNTFILLHDFLGYDLNKPNKDLPTGSIPTFKQTNNIIDEYLHGKSAKEVAEKYKICQDSVRGKFKKYHGMSRSAYYKKHPETRVKLSRPDHRKPVISIDKKAKVSYYKSITEASQATGVQMSNIQKCLYGQRKTAGGYSWKYA